MYVIVHIVREPLWQGGKRPQYKAGINPQYRRES